MILSRLAMQAYADTFVHSMTQEELPAQSFGPADLQLNALYVAQTYHGRGIGSRLMDRALKVLCVKSAPNLYLDVWNENEGALRFYARYGFEVIGETDVVVNSKVIGKDLIMRLALADAMKSEARRSM